MAWWSPPIGRWSASKFVTSSESAYLSVKRRSNVGRLAAAAPSSASPLPSGARGRHCAHAVSPSPSLLSQTCVTSFYISFSFSFYTPTLSPYSILLTTVYSSQRIPAVSRHGGLDLRCSGCGLYMAVNF
jgi:hypothetical protein